MKEINLFKHHDDYLTNVDLLETLIKLDSSNADVLYIHSSLNFGIPLVKKSVLLESIFEVLVKLEVPTIIVPTYTFSFCNGIDYDVLNSKSKMGVLNEYIRKNDSSIRSLDPLMTNSLIGKNSWLVKDIGKSSIGLNSTFDLLHNSNLNVKFLFLGPKIGDCFTYMHYIEELMNVPYRYKKKFNGNIINQNNISNQTYELFVRYNNVYPGPGTYVYENLMLDNNISMRQSFGNSFISVVNEKLAFKTYTDLLKMSPSFFIKDVFEKKNNKKIFSVNNMVAL